ncbi:hypothetical protein BGY98DRAFT_300037 [Russula aff. rugulosa BPL654]|nr:hypothetical protein BGY98DRAFT_300037 [Russula aff. rugulosa BPL654]
MGVSTSTFFTGRGLTFDVVFFLTSATGCDRLTERIGTGVSMISTNSLSSATSVFVFLTGGSFSSLSFTKALFRSSTTAGADAGTDAGGTGSGSSCSSSDSISVTTERASFFRFFFGGETTSVCSMDFSSISAPAPTSASTSGIGAGLTSSLTRLFAFLNDKPLSPAPAPNCGTSAAPGLPSAITPTALFLIVGALRLWSATNRRMRIDTRRSTTSFSSNCRSSLRIARVASSTSSASLQFDLGAGAWLDERGGCTVSVTEWCASERMLRTIAARRAIPVALKVTYQPV